MKLIAAVSDYDEAKVALETLEYGTDGVLLCPRDVSQIRKVSELIERIDSETYQMKPATVTRVEAVGSGDRVCVDTCSMILVEFETWNLPRMKKHMGPQIWFKEHQERFLEKYSGKAWL